MEVEGLSFLDWGSKIPGAQQTLRLETFRPQNPESKNVIIAGDPNKLSSRNNVQSLRL